MIIHDRYSAVGFNRPSSKQCCKSCEGMGFAPKRSVKSRESIFRGPPLKKLDPKKFKTCPKCTRPVAPLYFGAAKEFPCTYASDPFCDGWHTEACEKCKGTGSKDFVDRRRA